MILYNIQIFKIELQFHKNDAANIILMQIALYVIIEELAITVKVKELPVVFRDEIIKQQLFP